MVENTDKSRSRVPAGLQLTPFDPEFERDPYAVYARLRSAGSVQRDGEVYTVSGYAEVAALLKDARLTVDPRQVGRRRDPRADNPVTLREPGMMNLDGEEHTRLRRLVNRAFTPGSVSGFRPKVERVARGLVAELPSGEFDAVSLYTKPLPTIVIAQYIGVDESLHTDFKRWTDTLLLQGYPMPTEAQWQGIVAADAAMRECVRELVILRQRKPGNDLISRLLAAEASEAEVVAMCHLIIGAGNFTTTDLIGNALVRFSEADRHRIPEFVDDTLRLEPPSQSVMRWALEDVEIAGVTIEARSPVLLFIGSANHDPEAAAHLSFGRGVHHCLGAALARLETEVALEVLPPFAVQSFRRRKALQFRGCSEVRLTLE